MALRLYMDVHVLSGITAALRARGIEVLTAQEDDAAELFDPDLLDRVTQLGFVLFTNDQGFKREAALRQRQGTPFGGIIYAHQTEPIGVCVEDLTLMAEIMDMDQLANQLHHIPL